MGRTEVRGPRCRLGLEFFDEDVAEPDIVAVVLEEEGAGFGGEVFDLLVFAFCKAFVPVVAADFDFDDFDSVEPVFEVFAIGNDAGAVPFADWFEHFVVRTGDEVVEAAGAVGVFACGTGGVVDDLEFVAEGIGGAVFEAAVSFLGDLPFEFHFEVEIVLFREEVAAGLLGFVKVEDAVGEGPGCGDLGVLVVLPVVELAAFEKVGPIVGGDGICECGEGEEGENGESFHGLIVEVLYLRVRRPEFFVEMELASSAAPEQERGHHKGEQEWSGWFGDRGEGADVYFGVRSGAGEVGEFVGAAGQGEAKNGADGGEGIHGLRFCDALI